LDNAEKRQTFKLVDMIIYFSPCSVSFVLIGEYIQWILEIPATRFLLKHTLNNCVVTSRGGLADRIVRPFWAPSNWPKYYLNK
jgi:hypothetical protein